MIKKFIQKYGEWFQTLLTENGINHNMAAIFNMIIIVLLFFGTMYFIDQLIKKIIISFFKTFRKKRKKTLDQFLISSDLPKYLAHSLPLYIIWSFIPEIFIEFPVLSKFMLKFIDIYIIFLSISIVNSILRSLKKYLFKKPKFKDKPLESYLQVLMMFSWGVGTFLIINSITGYSTISVTTLSAASAILLLIFKDTILGFVASIQVTINDMVRIGDWITFSQYGADGNVIEITLATVRVQNWDNTYTTIPTYSLISDSFKNWRGMEESGGRRIKRAIHIKQTSVKFLTKELIEDLKKINLVSNYLDDREKTNDKFNKSKDIDKSLLINGENQTNLGVYRKYVEAYLGKIPAISANMLQMVRHLKPTEKGIPIEIYCFSKDQEWLSYEHIQADIFDHIIASAAYFDLEIFEFPTGNDVNFNK
ncbi:MAG: mechanosensitive ion channel [Flavobacteriaceae bacterium]|jgi:miniconductance mechanosensitive channel|nr:mechanosensitive ion channel [Flavobacteriaceae bacterium]MBT6705137.1 mechanosensitive ion channel [Flavobacteriaceae bacterium]MBT7242227.1 mechanosensitive ion channel [Flavobacteriaceae bacterium]